jgi:biopolymer transport protein ExbD
MDFGARRRRADEPTIEMAPLIDCVFLLLIFFLLTATYVRNPNIPIRLPQASIHEMRPEKRDLMVGITERGEIRYEGRETTLSKLRAEMQRIHADAPESMVLIQADQRSRHGRVVEVMDLARQIGFERIGIAIEARRGRD